MSQPSALFSDTELTGDDESRVKRGRVEVRADPASQPTICEAKAAAVAPPLSNAIAAPAQSNKIPPAAKVASDSAPAPARVFSWPNARAEVEAVLTGLTSPGSFAAMGKMTSCAVRLRVAGRALETPISAEGLRAVKALASHAGVGKGESTVVNLDVRRTWQLLPDQFEIVDAADFESKTLRGVVEAAAAALGVSTEYEVRAELYKLLVYEPGCFFRRHRDNERLDGMFATLVIELPSIYEGAELRVWSPSEPAVAFHVPNAEATTGHATRRATAASARWSAFYADCYHSVSELTAGVRTALVYSLVARPRAVVASRPSWRSPAAGPPALPTQPRPEADIIALATAVQRYSRETDADYEPPGGGGKPAKLVIVLSHHYTPDGLASGLDALKGRDRALGELVAQASRATPSSTAPALARLAARSLVEEGGEEYVSAGATDPVHPIVAEIFTPPRDDDDTAGFDAFLSLAVLWDSGEGTPDVSFHTSGPLIPLDPRKAPPPLANRLGPPGAHDLRAAYAPHWFYNGADNWGYDDGEEDYEGEREEWEDFDGPGKHAVPILSTEILISTHRASNRKHPRHTRYPNSNYACGDPKEAEFLGNGGCYMGRWYQRAVIVFWPRNHRADVALQTTGGRDVAGIPPTTDFGFFGNASQGGRPY